jgi:hypothetical protein
MEIERTEYALSKVKRHARQGAAAAHQHLPEVHFAHLT